VIAFLRSTSTGAQSQHAQNHLCCGARPLRFCPAVALDLDNHRVHRIHRCFCVTHPRGVHDIDAALHLELCMAVA